MTSLLRHSHLGDRLAGWPADMRVFALRVERQDGEQPELGPKAPRFRILAAPARYVRHARKRVLKIPTGWAWANHIATAWTRIAALHPT
ncbi:MAG: transposase [Thioalkalivibrio sp.]|nr:transposase [Thioalkalivibrio sp.]